MDSASDRRVGNILPPPSSFVVSKGHRIGGKAPKIAKKSSCMDLQYIIWTILIRGIALVSLISKFCKMQFFYSTSYT